MLGMGGVHSSVIVPVLFVMYMNDKVIHIGPGCQLTLYADDTSVFIQGKNDNTVQNGCSSHLSSLLERYNHNSRYLKPSPSNTSYMRFHNYQKSCNPKHVTIDNMQAQVSSHAKFLRLLIDRNLNATCTALAWCLSYIPIATNSEISEQFLALSN